MSRVQDVRSAVLLRMLGGVGWGFREANTKTRATDVQILTAVHSDQLL